MIANKLQIDAEVQKSHQNFVKFEKRRKNALLLTVILEIFVSD